MTKMITERQKASLRKAGYTEVELQGLTVLQASALLHYVSQNGWKRPTAAQVEATADREIIADEQACKTRVALVRIPSSKELKRLTKGTSLASSFAFDEGMSYLRYAVSQRDPRQQGAALCMLRAACSYKEWDKVLEAIGVPRTVANRQMQLARDASPKLSKWLKKRGVRVEFDMSAEQLRLAYQAAEAVMATNATNEALRETA